MLKMIEKMELEKEKNATINTISLKIINKSRKNKLIM